MSRKAELENQLVEVMKGLARCTQPEKSNLLTRKREISRELVGIRMREELSDD